MGLLAAIITRACTIPGTEGVCGAHSHTLRPHFAVIKPHSSKPCSPTPYIHFRDKLPTLKKIGPFCVKAKSKLLLLPPLCFEIFKRVGVGTQGMETGGEGKRGRKVYELRGKK